MSATAPARATWEDLLALGEGARAEVIAGVLELAPAPLPEHALAAGSLNHLVGGPFHFDGGGPGGWWILAEVDVSLGRHDIVRPDVSGWRRERLPSPWGMRPIEVVPDWVCEIVSPSSARIDRVKKRALYARAGVGHYWIVDVAERTVEALALVDDTWRDAGSFDEDEPARIPPFDAITLELSRLFPPEQANPTE